MTETSQYLSSYEQRKPQLNGTLCVEEQDNKILVYLKERPVWAILNWVSFTLLSLCDGKMPIRKMIDLACQLGAEKREDVANRVVNLFEYLADIEMVHFIGGEPHFPLTPNIYLPFTIYLNITQRCNLRCLYCYADGGEGTQYELATGQIVEMLNSAAKISNDVQINISGGEPLLRADIWDIAAACRKLGFRITSLTNGTLISRARANKIKKFFDNVLISIDGPDREHHDALRGQGSFDRAIKGFRYLLETECKLLVGTTITKFNIAAIPKMFQLPGMKPEMMSLNLFVPSGRGIHNRELRPTNREFFNLFKQLEPYYKTCKRVPGFRQFEPTKLEYGGRCRLGRRIISVAADGNVYPCHALHRSELCAGNILEQPLEEILVSSPILVRCRRLTVETFAGCKDCELRYFCGGGCRADAYFTTGNLNGRTSYCSFLRDVIKTYMWCGAPREPVFVENDSKRYAERR